MMTLRWLIGLSTTLATIGWLALAGLGSGFRRSFGASERSPLLSLVPAAVAMLVVASVVWPERRALLHVTALVMVALGIASVVVARETIFVASLGLIYAALWFVFYYRAVWAPAGATVGAP